MKNLLLLLLVIPGLAFGQITQFVTQQQYATRAALTLYVDPTGNDSNRCTSTGTSACLTVQGALGKIPHIIRHDVTINVAAGTYASAIVISNFRFEELPGTNTVPGLTITGSTTWTNITPTTSTATGTLTSAFTDIVSSPLAFAVVTDSSKTWTASDLKGSYISFTSGAASASRKQVIVGNTSTTILLNASPSAAPGIGDGYAIQRPSTIVGAITISGVGGAGNLNGNIILSDMTTGAMTIETCDFPTHSGIIMRRLRVVGNTTVRRARASISTQGNYIEGNLSVGTGVNGDGMLNDPAGYTKGGTFNISPGTFAFATTSFNAIAVYESTTGSVISGAQSLAGPVTLSTAFISTTRLWLRCNGATTGLTLSGVQTTAMIGNLRTEGCATGLNLSNGARVQGNTTAWTSSGATNELVIDGANSSFATFNALSPRYSLSTRGTMLLGP